VGASLGVRVRHPDLPLAWQAAVASVTFVELDGRQPRALPPDDPDFDLDELDGWGSTPDEAVDDCLRVLGRVTFGWVLGYTGRDAGTVRWDEGRLVYTPAQVAR
jgi:hypothetical protein